MKFTWNKESDEKMTLKKFLKNKGVSHRTLSSLKKGNGKVLVDGKKRSLSIEVGKGKITLILPPEKSDENVKISKEPLDIIYEDSNWLVVDKPPLLSSVPGPSNRTDTLVNRVKFHLWQQKSKDLVPHVITRLDRDTSGLVLVAKHRFAQGLINKQVEEHSIDKRYLAVVEGIIAEKHGIIDKPLGPRENGIGQMVTDTGKIAKTEYWVREYLGDKATLVECKLHPGRTHQIRAHFSSINHAWIGDELYGGRLDWGLERQALHAYQLAYVDPFTQEEKLFKSEMPKDLENLIVRLKN